MRYLRGLFLSTLAVALAFAGPVRAETTVELSKVHICCGACTKAIGGILKDIEGVKGECSQKEKTVTIKAENDAAAKKAVEALAAAGFHGQSDNAKIKMKGIKAPKGKVATLTIDGAHNCCGACCKVIKDTIKKVDGVTGDTAKPKAASFEVTGDFEASALVKALTEAGFHFTAK